MKILNPIFYLFEARRGDGQHTDKYWDDPEMKDPDITDAQLGRKHGVDPNRIRYARNKLGIERKKGTTRKGKYWDDPEMHDPDIIDTQLARKYDVAPNRISYARNQLGIKRRRGAREGEWRRSPRQRKGKHWDDPEMHDPDMTDTQLARKHGLRSDRIRYARNKLGIERKKGRATPRRKGKYWDDPEMHDPDLTNTQLARKHGVSSSQIQRARDKLGILLAPGEGVGKRKKQKRGRPGVRSEYWDDPEMHDPDITDAQLGRKHGVDGSQIRYVRNKLGIKRKKGSSTGPRPNRPSQLRKSPIWKDPDTLLFHVSDQEIANKHKTNISAVVYVRKRIKNAVKITKKLGIGPGPWWADADLGKVPDGELADRYNINSSVISKARNEMLKYDHKTQNLIRLANDPELGLFPDAEVGSRYESGADVVKAVKDQKDAIYQKTMPQYVEWASTAPFEYIEEVKLIEQMSRIVAEGGGEEESLDEAWPSWIGKNPLEEPPRGLAAQVTGQTYAHKKRGEQLIDDLKTLFKPGNSYFIHTVFSTGRAERAGGYNKIIEGIKNFGIFFYVPPAVSGVGGETPRPFLWPLGNVSDEEMAIHIIRGEASFLRRAPSAPTFIIGLPGTLGIKPGDTAGAGRFIMGHGIPLIDAPQGVQEHAKKMAQASGKKVGFNYYIPEKYIVGTIKNGKLLKQ